MLKILQARLEQCVNQELPDVQAGLQSGGGIRDQIANIPWIIKKARKFQKNIYFCVIDCDKPLTVWITTNWRILKDMGVPDHLICVVRNLYVGQEGTVRTGHETTDWFKMGKEYNKVVYCHPVHLTYLQRTSYKMRGWMNHKVESRLLEEISTILDMQMIHFNGRK